MSSMNCRFDTRELTSAKLKGTSCFLNVLSGDGQDDFSNDASCSVPDSNWSHTWVLVQGNQTTCQEGGNDRRLDEVSAEAFGYRGERIA